MRFSKSFLVSWILMQAFFDHFFSVLYTMYIKGKIMKIERNELEWKKKKKETNNA